MNSTLPGRNSTATVSVRPGGTSRQLLIVIAAIPILVSQPAVAQPQELRFAVASVKVTDDRRATFDTPLNGNRFTAAGVTLKMLISYAWDKQISQISGGPDWLDSERYDIDARPESAVTGEQVLQSIRSMLQSLLADRFKLAVHTESRQAPVYQLVLAKNGPRLKETSAGARVPNQQMARGQIIASATPLSQLLPLLSVLVQRQVVDKTGLIGKYDFTLTYTLEASRDGAIGPNVPAPVDPNAPSVFTALQEQLGLKLESGRDAVEVLAIDHAEKPDPN